MHPSISTTTKPPARQQSASDATRTTQREIAIDGIRLAATLMVILIHISGKGVAAGIAVQHWWASNFYESISRAAVPLFFMLTGALLLPREHSVSSIGKRIWRMVLPLFAWSLIYLVWHHGYRAAQPGWILEIISKPVAGHLWYLYSLIPAYALLPVLSPFFLSAKPRMQWFVIAAWFAAGSMIPTINYLFRAPLIGFDREFFYIYPGYMLLGAVLWWRKGTRMQLLVGLVAMAGGIAATGIGTYLSSRNVPSLNETLYQYYSSTVVIAAAGSFICLRAFFDWLGRNGSMSNGFVSAFGKASFGIYLVHPLVIWSFELRGYAYDFMNPWLAIPALMFAVVAISWLIVEPLRRIPGIRMIVPG